MRVRGRRESSGSSTSAAGSRDNTQSESPEAAICMATAWFPAFARRLTAKAPESIS